MVLQEGQNIGPYRVINQLGQGGMATVFKAYHAKLDRFVAIKMMHQAFMEDTTFLARFEREAQIVARLEHPHIVPVYDYAEHNNQPYLVMKFVEGRTLKGLLKEGALPFSEILRISSAIADALDYAHRQDVLHRDIKPSNIIIDLNAVPYLTDFGLARIAQTGESTLSQDMLLGTPHYMSPEQAMGKGDLNSRTDLYSFGVILYELIVGRVPFSADTPYAVIHDHIYRALPLPSTVNPEIPPAVETVLLKALAKDPADRFETATVMVEAMKKAASDAGLTELNASRISTSAISLARLRSQQESALPYTPPPSTNIPSPFASQSGSVVQVEKEKYGRRWFIGGIVSLIFICMLSLQVSLGTLSIFEQMTALQEVRLVEASRLLTVPEQTLEEAHTALTNNPNDPIAHLALARALWNAGQTSEAEETLRTGMDYTEDKGFYLMSAAQILAENGEDYDAIILYNRALQEAQGDEDIYFAIQEIAGEYFYNLALETENLTVADLRRLNNNLEGEVSPLIEMMIARALINEGRLALAEAALGRLLAQESTMPEAHLVLGELYAAQDKQEEAIEEWRFVLESKDAPEWVHTRAIQLIGFNAF